MKKETLYAIVKSPKLYRVFLPIIILFAVIFYIAPGHETSTPVPQSERPLTWAQPLTESKIGNFHKVTDGVYRGDRPTAEDLKELQTRGIKTLLDLETFHTDRYVIAESKTNFKFLHVRMNAWDIDDEDIVTALDILTDKNNYPIYVHCKHGSDRTGVVIAMYRIVVQGWSKEDAIAEMKGGGYGFHLIWENIPEYIQKVDVEKIKSSMLLGNV
jgi:protein tyrosine/serine phosphatase